MKLFSAIVLLRLLSTSAASPLEKRQAGKSSVPAFGGGLSEVIGNLFNAGYGVVSPGPNPIERRVYQESRTPQILGSKTVKVRYGPYKAPNSGVKNIFGENGVLYNYPHLNVDRPCSGNCILLGISAGLEYLDGKEANTANGMWLHHMVAFATGPERMDPTCVGKLSTPHLLMGTSPSNSERFFSVGNERSVVRFNPPWVKDQALGYYLSSNDKFSFIVDLMNQNKEDKIVYLTLTYDYIDGHPTGIQSVKAIWLDVAQCGTSQIIPPVQKGQFISQYDWVANLDGEIMGAGGHVHDGGTHLTLEVDGKLICDSIATYGSSGGAMGGTGMAGGMAESGHSDGHGATGNKTSSKEVEHITSMSPCFDNKLGLKELKKGQKWKLKAYYDYDKHPGMLLANGKQSNVMGISIVYVKNPKA